MEEYLDAKSASQNPTSLTEIYRSVGRLEGKIDYLVSHLVEHFEDDKEAFAEFKLRIQSLEKKVWIFSGGFSLFAFLTAYTFDLFQHHTIIPH